MSRPFVRNSVAELEAMLRKHTGDRAVLGELREELQFRKTPRARQLLREVLGLLAGEVPTPPKPLKRPEPTDQRELLSVPRQKPRSNSRGEGKS